jgi:AraC family transcriptional regulator
LAKIALELRKAVARRAGSPGSTARRVLAKGPGWQVADVVCTSGPEDRPFEERHSCFSIAVVIAGSFQYRSQCGAGRQLMTPGSLLLGNPGQYFECGHEHAVGDRCMAFQYSEEYFETVGADAGPRSRKLTFNVPRLPPLRALSPLTALACAGVARSVNGTGQVLPRLGMSWEELSVQLAAKTVQHAHGVTAESNGIIPGAEARVTRVIRLIERNPADELGLGQLAKEAGLSPYHFLRIFERLTGGTPHQYILRFRLREAAIRLASEPTKVLDIAFDCGFGDVSNFNHAFRAEFGISPRKYRLQTSNDLIPT